MLHIITTISQHPKGLDLHLRNLRWAVEGCEHQIHVQTFESFGLEAEGVDFLRAHRDPGDWYPFWRFSSPYLEEMAQDATAFLFVELDVLFTEQIGDLVRDCVENQELVVLLESPFLSLYTEERERIYPRIWEGGILIPGNVLRGALRHGVNMGRRLEAHGKGRPLYERFRDKLTPLWSTDAPHNKLGFQPLKQYFELASKETVTIDTMFDFGLYCFCHDVPCKGHGDLSTGYDMGPHVVHLRGIEVACRHQADLYDSVDALQKLPSWFQRRHLGSTALMLLLAEVYPMDDGVAKVLVQEEGVALQQEFALRLGRHGEDWLSPAQWERFSWAREVLQSSGGSSPAHEAAS